MAAPIPCPGCGTEASPYDDACPNCGFGVWAHVQAEGDRRRKAREKWLFPLAGVAFWLWALYRLSVWLLRPVHEGAPHWW